MFSLERELAELRDAGAIDADAAATLIARERRDIVNVYAELRLLTWAAVMMIATGAGIVVSKHLDRIGPLAIAMAISVASAACYAWAYWKRSREASLSDDYILLLAALLLSADVGYVEHTWHLLGRHRDLHLLILAIVHGATAYLFDSRLVLSVSLTSFAAWFGIRRDLDSLHEADVETAVRGVACTAIVLAWRFADARLRERRTFTPVFEHFAANVAFWSALLLTSDDAMRFTGCLLALLLAAVSGTYGVRSRQEMFVVYAWIYGLIAINIAVVHSVDEVLAALVAIVSTIAAIAGLYFIHFRMQERDA